MRWLRCHRACARAPTRSARASAWSPRRWSCRRRRRGDDDRPDRGGRHAEPECRPPRGDADDDVVHRRGRPRRPAHRIDGLQDDLRRRRAAVHRHARDERARHPARAPLPGGLRMSARVKEHGFRFLLLLSLWVGILTLIVLLISVFVDGAPRLNADLIFHFASGNPEIAGAQAAIMGTVWVVGLTALITIPLGVGAAIYLEEYADKERWFNRMIELNIQNLAAVPSIVYGILGLAFFVRGFIGLGQTVLAAALTLSLLVLPIVIIASREAIRAVPASIRQGSLALGATKWQTIWRQT